MGWEYTSDGNEITLGCALTKLSADIDCSSMPQGPAGAAGLTCIQMNCQANDCTLDCDGHKIIGPGRSSSLDVFVYGTRGIYVAPTSNTVTIKNCIIEGFDQGIYVTDSSTVTLAADVGSVTAGSTINVWSNTACSDFGLTGGQCCPGRDLPSPNDNLVNGEIQIEKTVMTKNFNGMFAQYAKVTLMDSAAIENYESGVVMQVCADADFEDVLLCNNLWDIRYQGLGGNSKYIQQASGFVTFSTKKTNAQDSDPVADVNATEGVYRPCPASINVCPN